MPGQYPDGDKKGYFYYGQVWNEDAGVWEKDEGHSGHSRLETVFKSATSAGTALFTLTSSQRAYITYLQMQPATRGKTIASLHLVASGATAATLMVVQLQQMTGGLATSRTSFQNLYKENFGGKPGLEIAAGKTLVFKSRPNAITSRCTISFYRVSTTGNK